MIEAFKNRAFAGEAVFALAAAVVAFAAGLAAAPLLLEAMAEAAGVISLYMSSPADLFIARGKLGITLGAAVLVSFIAVVVHRASARAGAPRWALAIYYAVPLLAALAGLALTVSALAAMTAPGPGGFETMVGVRELIPGFMTRRLIAASAPILWIAAFVIGRRTR